MVAAAPPVGSGVARRASAAVRRHGVEDRRAAGPPAGEQGNRLEDLAGAGSAAVRSAHGVDPPRSRRAALRRNRVFAWRRRRNGEVAAHARPPGAARGTAGAPRMTRYIGCETARELLDAFVDGELCV